MVSVEKMLDATNQYYAHDVVVSVPFYHCQHTVGTHTYARRQTHVHQYIFWHSNGSVSYCIHISK